MAMEIEILQGDEFRAKKETKFRKDEIFYNVYCRAMECVNDFINQMEEERDKEKNFQYKTGSNIIAFCGERGHGKTSAMQSFSNLLIMNSEDMAIPDVCGRHKNYYVLNSIDPSSLSVDESIVRVFISKLFYDIQCTTEKMKSEERAKYGFMEKRENLMRKFEVCFRSVDFSLNAGADEYEMDNLERLVQLGDSGALKQNLEDLVGAFLEFQMLYDTKKTSDRDNNKLQTYDYLVIQIDDADMAMGSICKLCEDIRNYFSLPNTIVLIASDMEQIFYAIEQEYIQKHRALLDTHADKSVYIENCNRMAAKYMEKMFPVQRRIELPYFQDNKQFGNIKLTYHAKGFENIGEDSKMQNQLLKWLYDRTGLIFRAEDEEFHPILPKTFRELTHFLKLLKNMHVVQFEKIFSVVRDQTYIEMLTEIYSNLIQMEEYFYEFWCANCLNETDRGYFIELRRKDDTIIIEKLQLLLDEKDDEKIGNAGRILISVLLNMRFVNSIKQEKLDNVLKIMTAKFLTEWEKIEQYAELKYNIVNYTYKNTYLRTMTDFQEVIGNQDIFLEEAGNNEDIAFDILKALALLLENIAENRMIIANQVDSTQDSYKQTESNYRDAWFKIALKNMITNIDVYQYVAEQIKIYIEKINGSEIILIGNLYEKYFKVLDSWQKSESPFDYVEMNAEQKVGMYLWEKYSNNEIAYAVDFLSNKQNFDQYIKEFRLNLNNFIVEFKIYINNMNKYIDRNESLPQMKSIFLESVMSEIEKIGMVLEKGELTEKGIELNNTIINYKNIYAIYQKFLRLESEYTNNLNNFEESKGKIISEIKKEIDEIKQKLETIK